MFSFFKPKPTPPLNEADPKPAFETPRPLPVRPVIEDKKPFNLEALITPYRPTHIKLNPALAMDSEGSYPCACDPPDMMQLLDNSCLEGLNSFIADGLGFMGYPRLSIMAQRPEYRKMVEAVSKEATREWIVFKGKGKESDQRIKELEAEFKRLKVKEAFFKASEHDGFFGIGHIMMDFGDAAPMRAFPKLPEPNYVAQGSLKRLVNLEPNWVYANDYSATDPLDPYFFKPRNWMLYNHLVDHTRVLTMVSREVPDILKPAFNFGGLALTQLAKPYVDNWLNTRNNVAAMIGTFSIVNLQTTLAQQMADCDFDGIDLANPTAILNRVQAFNQFRHNQGTFVTDKNTEDLKTLATPLGTLDSLQAQAQEQMASVAGQPLIKMFGIQPTGLNASSEQEMRVWYDEILSYQEHFFKPALDKLLRYVMLSLWGEIDEDIHYEFVQLWQMDDKDRALVNLTKAQTTALYLENGVTSPDEERERLANDEETGYGRVDLSGEAPAPFDDSDDEETQEPKQSSEER